MKRRRGFTLMEVVLALGVMAVALMALMLLLARQLARAPGAESARPAEVVAEVRTHLRQAPPETMEAHFLQPITEDDAFAWQDCCPNERGWKVTFTPAETPGEVWVTLEASGSLQTWSWLEVVR
ncbi:MAG: hypothetical protein E1N59_2224 [Puniceicoccaceae bacterium 5H]|nr:MAG: hypothetical protein E1N59_2224 [Puniceicoccaceae bacterium 5H]